jgi:Respiratory-chain NADH dehydrogenase, 49 Kd subunit
MAASELGAITVGFYMIEAREFLIRIVETLTGARLTTTYTRIGGVKHDLPEDFTGQVTQAFQKVRRILADCDRLLSRNRIFIDRMSGVGVTPKRQRLPMDSPDPSCALRESTTMSGRLSPIWSMTSLNSKSHWGPKEITTTALSAASKRSSKACG